MKDFLYLLLHFLTGQTWRSGIVVRDPSGMCLATASAPTPARAAATARRLMAAWDACSGIPIEALEAKAAACRADRQPTISVEPVEHCVPSEREQCAEYAQSARPEPGPHTLHCNAQGDSDEDKSKAGCFKAVSG